MENHRKQQRGGAPDRKRLRHLRAAGTGRQARGRGALHVLPEHKEQIRIRTCSSDEVKAALAWAQAKSRRLPRTTTFGGFSVGAGAKLLAADDQIIGGMGGVVGEGLEEIFRPDHLKIELVAGIHGESSSSSRRLS